MMWWDHGFGAWWMWIPGVLLSLLVIAAIVALIVLAVRLGRPHALAPGQDSSRSILADRLARGEITIEQYRELLATLDEGQRS